MRGEPGTGKSQLARAAAKALQWAFVSCVVDIRTEARDLRWTFDAVRRLADAQVAGVSGVLEKPQHRPAEGIGPAEAAAEIGQAVQSFLDEGKYVRPGPLWWAFDWPGARDQAPEELPVFEGCKPENGVVLLLDEIDKADSSVPNGLLESLGDQRFSRPGGPPIERRAVPLLVVITTNEERALPDAFLRRCLVRQLSVPDDDIELRKWLSKRGRAHFPKGRIDDPILEQAAKLLIRDRAAAAVRGFSPPGGAEYLDLLRALDEQHKNTADQKALLDEIGSFFFQKHPEPRRR